ncbi:MAG: hypothetical protein ACLTX3_10200 [Lachnospiraceae bacterium]
MAIAELKVYLFELPIIILIGMINAKFSFRKIIIIMFGVCGIAIGISMLGHFFESSGLDFLLPMRFQNTWVIVDTQTQVI